MQDLLKFSLLLVLEIPAIFMSILIFIYFITHPLARSNPKNLVWLLLLSFNFLQLILHLPMSMSFYYLGRVWPATDAYCAWWIWHQRSINVTCLMLTIRASVERHFLIFNPAAITGTSCRRWVYRFIPIIICILYPSLWYMVFVIISPTCTNVWDFNEIICGMPCYQLIGDLTYGIVDTASIIMMLIFLVTINIILIIRVIHEKNSHRQGIDWRRHRKMARQLWSILSLYLACWLPLAISLLRQFISTSSVLHEQHSTLIFILDFIPLLLPFVCLNVFPEITTDIREFLRKHRRNRVAIITIVPRAQP